MPIDEVRSGSTPVDEALLAAPLQEVGGALQEFGPGDEFGNGTDVFAGMAKKKQHGAGVVANVVPGRSRWRAGQGRQ